MTAGEDGIAIRDRPERNRYELLLDGRVAGFVEYRLRNTTITIVHTEVDPQHDGRGLGSRLAAHALDDARARGLRVRITCPFVRSYVRRHPEYGDIIRR